MQLLCPFPRAESQQEAENEDAACARYRLHVLSPANNSVLEYDESGRLEVWFNVTAGEEGMLCWMSKGLKVAQESSL
eukprot:766174-Hanusia_phi.AAC.3